MKEPCSNCPFRSDRPFRGLRPQRAQEIAESLHRDSSFHCHKTNQFKNGKGVVTRDSKLCVGAAIFLENTRSGGMLANLAFRLGCWAGEIKPDQLSKEVPVYQTIPEFIQGASGVCKP